MPAKAALLAVSWLAGALLNAAAGSSRVRPTTTATRPSRMSSRSSNRRFIAVLLGLWAQNQLAATVGFDRFGIQVHRHVLTSNIAFGLVLVVLIKQHATLAYRVDAQGAAGVGHIDQAAGRRAVHHRPGRRADRLREVVRCFMAARCGKGTDVEQLIQRLLLAQRVAVSEGVCAAPGPFRAVFTEGAAQVGKAGLPGGFDGIGAAFHGLAAAFVPPG